MSIVEVENVSMSLNLAKEPVYSLKEYFIKKVKRTLFMEKFTVLHDISFTLEKGEMFGIVGLNGSGKSTLLKTIAGIYKPTSGKVTVRGSIAPLIELGAGFDMDLTARENIYLNGLILGYSRKYIEENFDDIVAFAELSEFIDVPMKNFSSGMVARIAFAVATCTQPDILISDEILSVGDFKFQDKCETRIKEMIKAGTTVIFVSHSIEQVERLCSRCIWIEKGQTKMIGPTETICRMYTQSQ